MAETIDHDINPIKIIDDIDMTEKKISEAFQLEKEESGIAFLTIDVKEEKVNILSTKVMLELDEKLDGLAVEQDIRALIILSGKEDNFIAGADVNEIKGITDVDEGAEKARQGQMLFQKIHDLPFPVFVAIQGACVGGGLELALACHFRVAKIHPKTKIGLPEVKLGILPGFGGTQRLPRLIGIQKALGLILTGKLVSAQKAYTLGVVDRVISRNAELKVEVEKFALTILQKYANKDFKKRSTAGLVSNLIERTGFGRKFIFDQAKKQTARATKGRYPAPLKALESVRMGMDATLGKGLEIEAKLLGELIATDVSKNLISIFQMSETLRKYSGVEKQDVKPRPVQDVSILGAGVMGGGIAQLLAYNDIPARMKDINEHALGVGYSLAENVFKKSVKKGKMPRVELQRKMALISGSTEYHGFENSDFVIEAIVEDLRIKQKVLAELESVVKGSTILASNTSSLSITEIARGLKKPERVIGFHFFNPVHRMPLLEVIRGEKTSDETTATAVAFGKRLGKTVIVVKNSPGFLVNRVLGPYINEAALLLEDGATIDEIDNAMVDFGMPMGPLNLLDEVGLDIGYKVANILSDAFKDRPRPSKVIDMMVKSERLGKKGGRGFYIYEGKEKFVDPEVYNIIRHRNQSNKFSREDIQDRLFFIMLKEAAMCLEEKIVRHGHDVDAGMIFGIGFPPFRGGALRHADSIGLKRCLSKFNELASHYGERFEPPPSVISLAEEDGKFYGEE